MTDRSSESTFIFSHVSLIFGRTMGKGGDERERPMHGQVRLCLKVVVYFRYLFNFDGSEFQSNPGTPYLNFETKMGML